LTPFKAGCVVLEYGPAKPAPIVMRRGVDQPRRLDGRWVSGQLTPAA
jgi:hypothetical protein